jgi:hypothetical protein
VAVTVLPKRSFRPLAYSIFYVRRCRNLYIRHLCGAAGNRPIWSATSVTRTSARTVHSRLPGDPQSSETAC